MSYTVIREIEQTSIIDLVASIGGILGLFLGISVLSFIELFEIVLKILLLTFKHSNQNKTKNNSVTDNNASFEKGIDIKLNLSRKHFNRKRLNSN